jgi:hypothetical protein
VDSAERGHGGTGNHGGATDTSTVFWHPGLPGYDGVVGLNGRDGATGGDGPKRAATMTIEPNELF